MDRVVWPRRRQRARRDGDTFGLSTSKTPTKARAANSQLVATKAAAGSGGLHPVTFQ